MTADSVGKAPPGKSSETRAWLVQGPPNDVGSMTEYNYDNYVVTLGWVSLVDNAPRAAFTSEQMLRSHIDQSELKSSDKGTARCDIPRFFFEMNIGDFVVLPSKKRPRENPWIVIGRVDGDAIHDEEQPQGARLRRQVEWLTDKIPKSEVPRNMRYARRYSVVSLDLDQVMGVLRRFSDSDYMTGDEAGVWSADQAEFPEGAKRRVEVNRYERDPGARKWRLEHDDYTCQVCDLRFEDRYGEFALGYMQVHHKVPLSQITDHDNYRVNPSTDLVAVCPNCHAMLHHHPDKPCTVEKLKQEMKMAQE